MGEGINLLRHLFEAGETRTAVPAGVKNLAIVLPHAQIFRVDGIVALPECGLRMDPFFFAQEPLEAVAVVGGS